MRKEGPDWQPHQARVSQVIGGSPGLELALSQVSVALVCLIAALAFPTSWMKVTVTAI